MGPLSIARATKPKPSMGGPKPGQKGGARERVVALGITSAKPGSRWYKLWLKSPCLKSKSHVFWRVTKTIFNGEKKHTFFTGNQNSFDGNISMCSWVNHHEITMENHHFSWHEINELSMAILNSKLLVYQRVTMIPWWISMADGCLW